MEQKNTLVINLLAGPGAGKTTCAWCVASDLKKLGYVVEYVSEYPKELVWDEKTELLDGHHQPEILAEQEHRLLRLKGKVDFIVTDSPLILTPLYFKGDMRAAAEFEKYAFSRFSSFNNFCVFVERGNSFEEAGRIHNEEQSRKLDQQLKDLLDFHGIYFGSYSYERIHFIVPNCIKTYERLNPKN